MYNWEQQCIQAGYNNLHFHFNHLQVNHRENFVDPITGCQTQGIEGIWSHLKKDLVREKNIPLNYLQEYLHYFTFIYSIKLDRNSNKIFPKFLRVIALTHGV